MCGLREGWAGCDRWIVASYAVASFAQSLPMVASTEALMNDFGLAGRPEIISLFFSVELLGVGLLKPVYGLLLARARGGKAAQPCTGALCVLWAAALCVCGFASSVPAFFGGLLLTEVCMALVETTMDGAIAARATGKTAVELESAAFASRWVGTLAAALLRPAAGASRNVILATALAMPVLGVCVLQLLRSDAGPRGEPRRRAARNSEVGVLLGAAAFVFFRNLPPTEMDNWTAFLTTYATATSYSLTSSAGSIAAVLVSFLFRGRPRALFIGAPLIAAAVGCTRALLAAHPSMIATYPHLVVALEALVSGADSLSMLSLLVLAALAAPRGATAAGFSFVTLAIYFGDQVSALLGAWITVALDIGAPPTRSFDNLPMFILVCRVSGVLPLLGIACIRGAGAEKDEELLEGERAEDLGTSLTGV